MQLNANRWATEHVKKGYYDLRVCFFPGGSTVCAGVVTAVVKLCEARAAWLRREAAAALYLLMRANFQHGSGGNLTRVHLQVSFYN